MKIEELKGKKITVMGLGLLGGGVGTVKFLNLSGAKVLVTDIKSKEELASSMAVLKDCKGIEYVLGQHRMEDFIKTDMIVKTPFASWENKYVKMALDKKIPVEMDSSLFFKLCKNEIIGVSGSKGKTTTATLIFEILKKAGKNPVAAGIGNVSVLDKLRQLKKDSVVVFELSSWRLSALGRNQLSPKIAALTNIYPDHLNYYKNMEEYVSDKKEICRYQKPDDFCVINWDDEILNKLGPEINSQIIKFSEHKIEKGKSVYAEEGVIYLNDGIDEKRVLDLSQISLKGGHNLTNILSAIGVAYAMGISLEKIREAVVEFKKAPEHRLEFVRELRGVKYYNDTAATTPESAVFGIDSFEEPVILICGGSDKKLDMSLLAKKICQKVKSVIFFKGEATDKIITGIKKIIGPEASEKKFSVVESMEKTVELANESAESGDVVLLSPGAASFGLFSNELDRGNKFKAAVMKLE
ncbi:MAG: UDP-N-acetylmuramoyl-L-alanine--D-glutamate ligase [Candidatus Moranbacteria bacterium CG_4_9_14_3_um_filter_40_7]|nr:MAG: UDP-N-acetylmuramoyl-L-alanine--D-glutamate ligase [Candidatus Moranbacteria bacterium CG_4_9_14_3_um_filter_40_7]